MNSLFLEKEAIEAALAGRWQEAIEKNLDILKTNSKDIAALNRLAKAYWESNKLSKAQFYYKKVLVIDQYNPIALKNLKRLEQKSKKTTLPGSILNQSFNGAFLEEAGKTVSVNLCRLTSAEILAGINTGEQVCLAAKKHFVVIQKKDTTYLGSLPETLSWRLIPRLKSGNKYEARVLKVDPQTLEVFIREISRCPKYKDLPSF